MAILRELHARYRRAGADLPFGDPRRAHGVGMEGYYWRLTDPRAGRVVIALCGLCAAPGGRWALVALAAHPEGIVRHALVPVASADPRGLGVRAGEVLIADAGRLRVDLGDGARLDVSLAAGVPWPRRALGGSGVGQVIPGLGQYWHPHLLGGEVDGHAELGAEQVDIRDAVPYAEKNWGSAFAGRWWWGQAQGFDDPEVCVAFAGGRLQLGRATVAPTALVVRLGDDVLRLAPPLARTVAAIGADSWDVRGRQGRLSVELHGSGGGDSAALLPVPVPLERRVERRSRQVLAGRLAVVVRRGARVIYRGESSFAGLERDAG